MSGARILQDYRKRRPLELPAVYEAVIELAERKKRSRMVTMLTRYNCTKIRNAG